MLWGCRACGLDPSRVSESHARTVIRGLDITALQLTLPAAGLTMQMSLGGSTALPASDSSSSPQPGSRDPVRGEEKSDP